MKRIKFVCLFFMIFLLSGCAEINFYYANDADAASSRSKSTLIENAEWNIADPSKYSKYISAWVESEEQDYNCYNVEIKDMSNNKVLRNTYHNKTTTNLAAKIDYAYNLKPDREYEVTFVTYTKKLKKNGECGGDVVDSASRRLKTIGLFFQTPIQNAKELKKDSNTGYYFTSNGVDPVYTPFNASSYYGSYRYYTNSGEGTWQKYGCYDFSSDNLKGNNKYYYIRNGVGFSKIDVDFSRKAKIELFYGNSCSGEVKATYITPEIIYKSPTTGPYTIKHNNKKLKSVCKDAYCASAVKGMIAQKKDDCYYQSVAYINKIGEKLNKSFNFDNDFVIKYYDSEEKYYAAIRNSIDRGFPVLAHVSEEFNQHYVAVVGYYGDGLRKSDFITIDPYPGPEHYGETDMYVFATLEGWFNYNESKVSMVYYPCLCKNSSDCTATKEYAKKCDSTTKRSLVVHG